MPWTLMHLITLIPTFIIEVIFAFVLVKYLKNKDENTRYIPFKVIAIILTIMEVLKQVVSYIDGYSLYHLPFHFCSLFIFLLPLHAFYKGKHKNLVDNLTLACCSSLFLFMIIAPSIIYGEGAIKDFFKDYIAGHSVVFHCLVCFYFMLMIGLNKFKFNKNKDIKKIFIIMSIYSLIAAILAQTLETNFNNFYSCGMEFIDDLRVLAIEKIGWLAEFVYVLCVYSSTVGFTILNYLLSSKLVKYLETKRR